MILARIEAPHFVGGLEIHERSLVVVRTPPILKYMRGWTLKQVLRYVKEKDWSIENVKS